MRWSWVVFVVACASSAPADLRIDIRTDLVAANEFNSIELIIDDGEPMVIEVDETLDYVSGTRLYQTQTTRGDHMVQVVLKRSTTTVVSRRAAISVRGDFGVTLVLTRDCRGVECPGDGDPSASECLGGRCVDAACSPETPEYCSEPDCTTAADCGAGAPCGLVECSAGSCLYRSDSVMCIDTTRAYCDPVAGCRDNSLLLGAVVATASPSDVFLAYGISGTALVGDELRSATGGTDLFVEARAADGVGVAWTAAFQTDAHEYPTVLEMMPTGQLLLGGGMRNGNLFADAGFTFPDVAGTDAFIGVLDATDGAVQWAVAATSDEPIDVLSAAADETGRVAAVIRATAAGAVAGLDLNLPTTTRQPVLVMLDAAGAPLWQLPLDQDFEIHSIVTNAGSTYVGGCTHGELSIGGLTLSSQGKDGAVVRIDDTAGAPVVPWLERVDAPAGGDAAIEAMVIDDVGNLHMVGWMAGETTAFGGTMAMIGGEDALMIGVDPDANLIYARSVGSALNERLLSIDHDAGTLLLGGSAGAGFEVDGNAFSASGGAAFLLTTDVSGAGLGLDVGGSPETIRASTVALTTTTRCSAGTTRDAASDPFYRGLRHAFYFDCDPR